MLFRMFVALKRSLRGLTGDDDSGSETALLPPGIVNLGNTCFLNTVLQSLASSEPFVEYVAALASRHPEPGTRHSVRATPCLTDPRVLCLTPVRESRGQAFAMALDACFQQLTRPSRPH